MAEVMLTAISEENKRSNPDLSSHDDAQVDTSFNINSERSLFNISYIQ